MSRLYFYLYTPFKAFHHSIPIISPASNKLCTENTLAGAMFLLLLIKTARFNLSKRSEQGEAKRVKSLQNKRSATLQYKLISLLFLTQHGESLMKSIKLHLFQKTILANKKEEAEQSPLERAHFLSLSI